MDQKKNDNHNRKDFKLSVCFAVLCTFCCLMATTTEADIVGFNDTGNTVDEVRYGYAISGFMGNITTSASNGMLYMLCEGGNGSFRLYNASTDNYPTNALTDIINFNCSTETPSWVSIPVILTTPVQDGDKLVFSANNSDSNQNSIYFYYTPQTTRHGGITHQDMDKTHMTRIGRQKRVEEITQYT